jgi:hypothetical protein
MEEGDAVNNKQFLVRGLQTTSVDEDGTVHASADAYLTGGALDGSDAFLRIKVEVVEASTEAALETLLDSLKAKCLQGFKEGWSV